MTRFVAKDQLDLSAYLRPGDRIVIGQACGEPRTLVEALIEQGGDVGGLEAFIGSSFSGLFTPETATSFTLSSLGAIGSLRSMAKAGVLRINRIDMSEVGRAIENDELGCDVALIQVSSADENDNHSCALVSDHIRSAVAKARLVIAEINAALPFTQGETVHASEIDVAIRVNRPPLEVMPVVINCTERAIAQHCSGWCCQSNRNSSLVGAAIPYPM